MRVEQLSLRDFKSYREADVDFSTLSLASVVGANGAGKSSILEAIVFALTGGRQLRSLDAFVRKGAEECRVALTFSIGGKRYRLTRTRSTRSSGKSTLELCREEGGLWVAEGTQVKEVEARVASILAVDEELLLLTSVITQEDAGAFFRLQPAQRLEGLGRILQLDQVYGPLAEHMKARAAECKEALETTRREAERLEGASTLLAGLNEELTRARGGEYAARVAVGEAQHAAEEAAAEAQAAAQAVAGADTLTARYRELTARRQELEVRHTTLLDEERGLLTRTQERERLEAELATKNAIEAELAELERMRDADRGVNEQRGLLDAELRAAKAARAETSQAGKPKAVEEQRLADQIMDLNRRLIAICDAEIPTCDRCGQPIQSEALERTVGQLRSELESAEDRHGQIEHEVEALRARFAEQDATVKDLEAKIAALPELTFAPDRHQAATDRLKALGAIPARLAEIDALTERLTACRGEIAAAGGRLEDPGFLAEIAQAEAAMEAAAETAGGAKDAAEHQQQADAALEAIRRALSDAEKAVARLEGQIAGLADVPAQLAAAKAEAVAQERSLADYELLKKAFSKWGVPALIVRNVLLALEREVNELLGLYDGGLALRFESEKETRDGARDSLEILVYDGQDWRSYDTFSGGERYRVASAMRLGLSKLLAHRAGSRVETLLVDEPEGLDAAGRAHLAKILERMSQDVGLVLLLTHYEDLKDAMPQQIVVSRGEDGLSRVEVAA
jgi:exonuclease SbcC